MENKKSELVISIIIPMYNVSDYIEECLQSIKEQSYVKFECLLIDDGSTDETTNLVKEFINDDSRFRLIEQENGGPAKARNNGLKQFKGDYVLFVDSDDLLAKESLEMMIQSAVIDEAEIVIGKTKRFNKVKDWEILGHVKYGLNDPGEKNPFTDPGLFYGMGPASKLFKRELITGLFFDENKRFAEDQLFVFTAYMTAKKIQVIDYFVYFYQVREGEQSLTQTYQKQPLENLQVFIDLMGEAEETLIKLGIENYEPVLTDYFNRLFEVEIRVLFKNMLLAPKSVQQPFLATFNSYLEKHVNIVTRSPHYYTFVLREQIDYLFLIKGSAMNELVNIMKLSEDGEAMPYWLKKQITSLATGSFKNTLFYRVKAFAKKVRSVIRYRTKKLKRLFKKIWTAFLRKIMFPIYKLTSKKDKIVFMTNKEEELGGSFLPIYNELIKTTPKNKLRTHLKKVRRNFWESNSLLKDVASAKVIFLDDYYNQLYGLNLHRDTEVVQLWHAAGAFKKFSFSALGGVDSNTVEFETRAHRSYTKVVCSSDEIKPFYAEAFNISEEKVLPLGLARTDKLFKKDYQELIQQEFKVEHPEIKGRKVVTYAPTFRGGARERQIFKNHLDIKSFNEKFSDEYVLVLKMHPSVRNGIKIPEELADSVFDMSSMDMNDLLLSTDILITDYSSVIFDYSILKKPMLFFAYDLEDYMAERSFYYDYETFVPGPIVTNNEDLFEAIENIELVNLEKVESFSNRFFNNQGESAKKIVEIIKGE